MNRVSEREKTRETSFDRAKYVRERGRKRERENDQTGCFQGLAESGNALFFTVAFIP